MSMDSHESNSAPLQRLRVYVLPTPGGYEVSLKRVAQQWRPVDLVVAAVAERRLRSILEEARRDLLAGRVDDALSTIDLGLGE